MDVPRSSNNDTLLLQEGDKVSSVTSGPFLKGLVDGIIRVRKEDGDILPEDVERITHFNLQHAGHRKCGIYALPLIVKSGYYTSNEEVQPLLSFTDCIVAKCTGVRNNVQYDEIKSDAFKHSFPNIGNVEELKTAIVARYRESMPELSKEEILSLGVAITELTVLCRWEKHARR